MNDRIIGILEDSFTQLIIPGITATIPLTLISFAFGLAIALLLAIVRTKDVPVLSTFARLYVWIFRELVCEDCGAEFIFTAGEQEFYAEKGLVNKPKRCPDCRKARRNNNRKKRRMYDAVCSKCGAQTQVTFKPIPGKEVYCKDCFTKEQATEN